MTTDNSYPGSWDTPGTTGLRAETPAAALSYAVESYVAALSDQEFAQLVGRTRPGGR